MGSWCAAAPWRAALTEAGLARRCCARLWCSGRTTRAQQALAGPGAAHSGVPLPLASPPQCYNISTTAPLTAAEAETLAWLLRETFEPELLTAGTEFPSPAAIDAVVEVRLVWPAAIQRGSAAAPAAAHGGCSFMLLGALRAPVLLRRRWR